MTGSRLRQGCSCKLDPQSLDRAGSAQGGTLGDHGDSFLMLLRLPLAFAAQLALEGGRVA